MPCYSYSDGNPVFYADNIEKVYSASGATYSFSDINWICEFPVTSQLKVYTRASAGAEETQLIENTDYVFDVDNNNIVFNTAPTSGQVVIRRSTPSDRMLFRFVDGAKLTAEQLNTSFHQLLFAIQEKEFASDKISYFSTGGLTVEGGVSPLVFDLDSIAIGDTLIWQGDKFVPGSSGGGGGSSTFLPVLTTPIEPGSILVVSGIPLQWRNVVPTVDITVDNLIFKDRVFYKNRTIGNDLSYTSDSTSIDVSSKSFLTRFKSASPGLQWVLLDAPTGYHLVKTLIPAGQVHDDPEVWFNWVQETLEDIIIDTGNPTKMKFYWNLGLDRQAYQREASASSGSNLCKLARNHPLNCQNTQFWDHPCEFYSPYGYIHVPFFADYNDFSRFSSQQSLWCAIIQERLDDQIQDMFGSIFTSTKHRFDNPWVYGVGRTESGATSFPEPTDFDLEDIDNSIIYHKSKVHGYGIKSFYLSIPQCNTSTLKLPVFLPGSTTEYFYFQDITGVNKQTVIDEINKLGSSWEPNDPQTITAIGTPRTYCDFYLLGLRDMAFAGARQLFQFKNDVSLNTKQYRDTLSRYYKAGAIKADYSGWNTFISSDPSYPTGFRRLEIPNETIKPITFRIPEQIIYYNEIALALGIDPIGSSTLDDAKKDVRFQGLSRHFIYNIDEPAGVSDSYLDNVRGTRFNVLADTVSPKAFGGDQGGLYFKADTFWEAWSRNWSELIDGDSDFQNPRTLEHSFFNEACIDWFIQKTNLSSFNNQITVNPPSTNSYYNTWNKMPPLSNISAAANQLSQIKGKYFVPWLYRSNELHVDHPSTASGPQAFHINDTHGYQGTHLLNIDANCLFSQASNFIPDPVDEYVFRIISKGEVASLVRDPNKEVLNSSVILEWGLNNQPGSGTTKVISSVADIFADTSDIEALRASSRYDYSKLKVYIKNEQIENHNGTFRYVITLAIQTPRIKSIGYSKVFRRFTSQNLNLDYPNWNDNGTDSEKDGGPWNFSLIDFRNTSTTTGTELYTEPPGPIPPTIFDADIVSFGDGTMDSVEGDLGTTRISSIAPMISGRNECAVKFTRAGIPGNLWIRLSVLTSDPCERLLVSLDPDNLNFSDFTEE
jgi:hypothetical protein